MCGIIAAFNTENKVNTGEDKKKKKKEPIASVNEFIVNQYENQATRGKEGYGIIMIGQDKKIELKRATTEPKFLLDLYMKEASMIVAHHRMPTSSDNKLDQTHPIYVSNTILGYRYLVVHNGVVSNDNDLKDKHEKLGFKYVTEYTKYFYQNTKTTKFNDTEALAIEIALFIEGKTKAIGTLCRSAFVVVQLEKETDKATKVFFGRKGGDLNMSKTRGKMRLSSEGEGSEVKDLKLYSFEIGDTEMDLKSKDLIFEDYKKPEEKVAPSKEAFAKGESNIPRLPFRGIIGGKVVETKGEDPIFEKDGKTHTNKCCCDECYAAAYEGPSERGLSNNIVQTEDIEIYDEKLIDSAVAAFENEIRNEKAKDIKEKTDEALENICDQISTVVIEYKDNLYYSIEMGEEENYMTQIRIFMDTMKAISEKAEEKYKEAEEEEETVREYTKDIAGGDPYADESWHGSHHHGHRGPVGFGVRE